MMKFKSVIAGAIFVFAQHSTAQNLFTNPSFETGDLTGWTSTPTAAVKASGDSSVPGIIVHPRSGNFAIYTDAPGTISQNVLPIPGQTYVVGFYLAEGANPLTNANPGITIGSQFHNQLVNIPASTTYAPALIRQFYSAPATTTLTNVSFNPHASGATYDDFFFQPYSAPLITSGPVKRLILSGDEVPGHLGSSYLDGDVVPFLNDNGTTVSNVPTSLGRVLLVSDGKQNKPVVVRNDPVPDGNGLMSPGFRLGYNSSGQVAFDATLLNTSGGSTDNFGVYFYNGSTISTIARKGQTLPGGDGTISSVENMSVNNQGKVLFTADLTGGSSANALFLYDGTSLISLARYGQSTPSGN